MKKYALVMALALAASLAQADVAVYGKVRQYVNNDQVGTASGVTALTNDTSRLGFRASEKLANGFVAAANIASNAENSILSAIAANSFARAMFTIRKVFSNNFEASATSGFETSNTSSQNDL